MNEIQIYYDAKCPRIKLINQSNLFQKLDQVYLTLRNFIYGLLEIFTFRFPIFCRSIGIYAAMGGGSLPRRGPFPYHRITFEVLFKLVISSSISSSECVHSLQMLPRLEAHANTLFCMTLIDCNDIDNEI